MITKILNKLMFLFFLAVSGFVAPIDGNAAPLPPPEVVSPSTLTSDRNPVVRWTPIVGANLYDLWIDAYPDAGNRISQFVRANVQNSNSYQFTKDLSPGTYDVWVKAYGSGASPSAWGAKYTFRFRKSPPTQCSNLLDDDNDSLVDRNDPGCWADTQDAKTYVPEATDESRATTECQDGIDNDLDGQVDLADKRCRDSLDYSEETDAVNDGLLKPIILGPVAHGNSATPEISWSAVAGATDYDLWVDYLAPLVNGGTPLTSKFIRKINFANTSYAVPSTLPNGEYRVWVRAFSDDGKNSKWSDRYDFFITNGLPPIQPLTVIKPAVGAYVENPVRFKWQSDSDVTRFELKVHERGNPGNVVYMNNKITTNRITLPDDLPCGCYSYWLRPIASDGRIGPWRDSWFCID